MASEHHFHLGAKTEHAQGELLDKTEQQQQQPAPSAPTAVDDAHRRAGDAADCARDKAHEGKEQTGNIFQKTGGAVQNAVSETVHEVQNKLGKVDDPAKVPMED